ncbi:MAG TPA: hypothetical protein ENK73_04590 [Thiomicrospira sp.]|nr:hypothetical protein [Thiomicrospira sp.]
MKNFDHMSALQQLIDMDTTLFKEELYYPWYIKQPGITILVSSWLVLMVLIITITAIYFSSKIIPVLVTIFLISILFGFIYLRLFKQQLEQAKSEALSQIMQLEQREFMKGIQPFVSADRQSTVNRITQYKDFTPQEYASITLATQSRVLFNTEAFIKDVERMFSDTDLILRPLSNDNSYSETTFKVPEKAKKNYQKLKEKSTFTDVLSVSLEAKQAIIKKAHEAANKAALGRNNYL